MNWYISVLKQYATFSGRARRREYWFFCLFNVIISFILNIVDGMTGTYNPELGVGFLGGLYVLVVFLPSIAVTVRRLHDTDRSGWWILITLIPIVGAIVLFVFMLFDGTRGANRFGEDPKGESHFLIQ
ncbi:uncharacterized membrane protein YhaH (DUF805 family) [Volucribacter psittacicida]|uniref:Uncharacterized membrane protein YhaH (DUF805 family) n=1 Tax=Volucribacter psittacicida TaxID=203482 RepID=A0A4R1FXF2_9PAST|nr:DUF805 domain-containing protein [Volucribacter psittacicida]TCJ98444.1 uncharacterized membrane protein YhaH (DUF805 family) [Volucribacter psittacicida]